MPDLREWITQQIDRREHGARAAAELQALAWSCPSTGVVDLGDDLLPTGDRDVAYHIVAHDPEAVLRRCAADRKILAEHRPAEGLWIDYYACQGCGMDGTYSPDWIVDHVNDCPTLLALAEGYGLTEEQRATLDRPEKERPEPGPGFRMPDVITESCRQMYAAALGQRLVEPRDRIVPLGHLMHRTNFVDAILSERPTQDTNQPMPDWIDVDLTPEPTPAERAFAVVEPHLSALALYKPDTPKERP